MTEARFTKGPWVKGKWGQLVNPEGKSICVWDCGIAIVSRDEEAEANSRIIAAAPDMYEALELAIEIMDEAGWSRPIQRVCREALAKARGEQ